MGPAMPAGLMPDDAESQTHRPGVRDANAAGIFNEAHPQYKVSIQDIDSVLKTNPDGLGAGTARPDIFQDGHYSAFDLLRYLSVTRSDIELSNVVHWQETGLGTYTFDVSWDANGDGDFDDEEDSKNDPNWHFRLYNGAGQDGFAFNRARGNMQGFSPAGEANYLRIDKFWVQRDLLATLQPFSKEMTARRQWIQRQQVEAFEANGGVAKVTIVGVDVSKPGVPEFVTMAQDIEVEAFNHRSDIFQPGVLTSMDAVLSGKEELGGATFTYWDTLSTGADVGHYVVSSLGGLRNKGLFGFIQHGLRWDIAFDEQGKLRPDMGDGNADFKLYPICDWSADGRPKGVGEGSIDKETCDREWSGGFGGEAVHLAPDVYHQGYGHQILFFLYISMYDIFQPTPNLIDEPVDWDFDISDEIEDVATLQTFTLPEEPVGNAPILDENHFGWKIADCNQCHNEEKNPQGHGGGSWPINSADGFNETQPYYCASCHGSNGAPQAHGESGRCFWCHSAEGYMVPKNHGDTSTKVKYSKDQIQANKDENMLSEASYTYRGVATNKWGNFELTEQLWSSKNSDWDKSKAFPDPYACVSCHPNK